MSYRGEEKEGGRKRRREKKRWREGERVGKRFIQRDVCIYAYDRIQQIAF